MLKNNIIEKLNAQVNAEMHASNVYLQMAAWCEGKGLAGAASFFKKHVPEELMHRDKFIQYLFECGAPVRISAMEAPKADYAHLVEVIETAYAHEQKVTAMINEIANLAFDERDFNTFNMLQWFIAEQREEEVLFRGILDQIALVAFKGQSGEAMYHINNYLQRLAQGL
jgi:ferritin